MTEENFEHLYKQLWSWWIKEVQEHEHLMKKYTELKDENFELKKLLHAKNIT